MPAGLAKLTHDIKDVKLLGVFVGSTAPDFIATTLGDAKIKLSDFRGKIVLIDFWATWCAPCVAELPNVTKAYEQFADKGLVVISISFDKDAATARKFARGKQMTWPQIWADGGDKSDLAKLYNVSGIPATFLIGPDGKVVAKDLRGDKLLASVRKQVEAIKTPAP